MDKKTILRYILDIIMAVVAAAWIWTYNRIERLENQAGENASRIRNIEVNLKAVGNNVDTILSKINSQNEQIKALILVTTFRADPWSGTMMEALQDELYDILKSLYPELRYSDMPNVKVIQKEYAEDLIPIGIEEHYNGN